MKARALGIWLTAVLTLMACGNGTSSPQSTGPKQGDVLRVAIGIDPDTLDPAAQTTTTASQIVDMMAETLVTMDSNGALKPLLAEKWEPAADGLSFAFTLRKGVKFQDGSDFNAQAVKFSIDRLVDPKTFKTQPGILGVIASTAVVDDLHVKFTLKNPLAPFVAAMTQTNAAIVSPASVNSSGNTPDRIKVPVGTGPYKFKERVEGDHISVARNDAYWGTKPSYARQELRIVPEAATREALVRAQQVDVIALPPAADLPALQNDHSVKVLIAPSDRTIQIVINTVDSQQPLLQNPKVRQALNYAVDKDAIIKNILFGAAVALDAPMSKTLFGYCQVGRYPFDQARAKSMLQEAGASGMTLRLVSPTGRYVQDIQAATSVADYLRQAGLKVDGPATSDWPTYLGKVNVSPDKASTDLHLLGWAPAYLDAQQQMEQFLSQRIPPKGLETSYYKNAAVEDLISKGNAATDESTRKDAYCKASKQIWDDAPWIFLYNQKFPIVYSSKVTGVGSLPNEKFTTISASPA